jgi:hypothetical protein
VESREREGKTHRLHCVHDGNVKVYWKPFRQSWGRALQQFCYLKKKKKNSSLVPHTRIDENLFVQQLIIEFYRKMLLLSFIAAGIAVGFPWNSLISASDFFDAKIESVSLSTLESYLTLSYLLSNLLTFGALHHPYVKKYDDMPREKLYVKVYFVLNFVSFAFLFVSSWLSEVKNNSIIVPAVLIAVVLGITSAIYQHALFAFAARDAEREIATNSFVFGFAVAGTLASGINLFTRSMAKSSAIYSLGFAMTLLALLCGYASLQMGRSPMRKDSADEEELNNELLEQEIHSNSVVQDLQSSGAAEDNWRVFRFSISTVGVVMASTLMVFPTVIASLKPNTNGTDQNEFTAILFFLFNV